MCDICVCGQVDVSPALLARVMVECFMEECEASVREYSALSFLMTH